MEYQKPYAGNVQYIPQLELTAVVIHHLQKKLIEKGVVEEGRKPKGGDRLVPGGARC